VFSLLRLSAFNRSPIRQRRSAAVVVTDAVVLLVCGWTDLISQKSILQESPAEEVAFSVTSLEVRVRSWRVGEFKAGVAWSFKAAEKALLVLPVEGRVWQPLKVSRRVGCHRMARWIFGDRKARGRVPDENLGLTFQ
jgi:hypothetical protein